MNRSIAVVTLGFALLLSPVASTAGRLNPPSLSGTYLYVGNTTCNSATRFQQYTGTAQFDPVNGTIHYDLLINTASETETVETGAIGTDPFHVVDDHHVQWGPVTMPVFFGRVHQGIASSAATTQITTGGPSHCAVQIVFTRAGS